MKNVFFCSTTTNHFNTPFDVINKILNKITSNDIQSKEHVALKIHFGEWGNFNYIKPQFLIPIIEKLKQLNAKIFLTDTNTLYQGMRFEAVDHINCGIKNGFGFDALQVPIIISDGIKGQDYVEVNIKGKHFPSVKIASNIHYADYMICLSHFKLHELTGFGGAIKNLGMGCAAKIGKHEMHSSLNYTINQRCRGCGTCINFCLHDAITLTNKKAHIDPNKCTGCGHCFITCRKNAIKTNFSSKGKEFAEKLVEYAHGAMKNKTGKSVYINFLQNNSAICDCVNYTPEILVPDIGILASDDPVACDQACVDLMNSAYGNDLIKTIYPHIDYEHCLKYAESLGVGSRRYNLIDVSHDGITNKKLKLSKIAKNFYQKS